MTADQPPPSLGALFVGFLSVGMMGFGGVMPFIRRMVVDRRRWLDQAEFTDTLALCQLLPGPNVTNLAVNVGARYQGLGGAVVAVAGLVAMPIAIVLLLGALLQHFGETPVVARALLGLAAAGSGLVLANAVKIGLPLRRRPAGLAVAAAAFGAVALLRLPLIPVLLIAAPLSVALHAVLAIRARTAR